MTKDEKKAKNSSLLGDFIIERSSFPKLNETFKEFHSDSFLKLPARKRFHRVNQVLLKLIQDAPEKPFLLPAIVEFIEKVNNESLLREHYNISLFEYWLNQFSDLSPQDNYQIRGKIMGKYIPRDDYQSIFPVGMDKTYNGTHFVTAHLSPDVDTMVASFWGWVDAFAARVSDGRHIWGLPGGPPDSPVTKTFRALFGESVFDNLAYTATSISLSSIDLITQKGVMKKKGDISISSLDLTGGEKAIILVDDAGHYLGDWHTSDVEPIRKIVIRFKSLLRWFENNLHGKLISFFAKKTLHVKEVPAFLASIFDIKIQDCEPAKEFTERQLKELNDFFIQVLELPKGLQSTFRELNEGLTKFSVLELAHFQKEVEKLTTSTLFDASGHLKEDRPAIFHTLEKLIHALDEAIRYVRDYAERLDVAINIKSKVFGFTSQFATMRSDVEDLRIKMKRQEYLTIVVPEEGGKLAPIGVVWATTLQRQILGTVTFRDFCNQEEVKMASYLTPISVVDHHKTSLKTSTPPMALIGDAQSCNVLLAEQAFAINSKYSCGSSNLSSLAKKHPTSLTEIRLLQRLLQKHLAEQTQGSYFVHPNREFVEYFSFLHAILDDTDLLTKVSKRDVECVAELLNRIKSLTLQEDTEIVNLDDISRSKEFAQTAAKRILRNPEMYSFYKKIYESKESEIDESLKACLKGICEPLFVDTKEQNGCCRIGQIKLFTKNFQTYRTHALEMQRYWVNKAETVFAAHPEIDLHIQMISTVSSAEEVYNDKIGHYEHQDEMWFWVPPTQKAYDHLSSFLTAFQAAHRFASPAYLDFFTNTPEEMQQIFIRNCPTLTHQMQSQGEQHPIVILHFKAGFLNSRKAMISPFLPKIA